MQVHRYFGLGFPEIIYKRSLAIELKKAGLSFQQESERDIVYNGQVIGKRRLDLVIENKVLVELKAIHELDSKTINQTLNYLKVFDLEVGLVLNFGSESLQFKRLINTKKHPRNPF